MESIWNVSIIYGRHTKQSLVPNTNTMRGSKRKDPLSIIGDYKLVHRDASRIRCLIE